MNNKLKAALLLMLSIGVVAWLNAQEGEQPAPCGAQYTIPYTEVFEPLTLTLPNTTPFNQVGGPRLVVEKVAPAALVPWAWLSCDEVRLPIGSEITVRPGTEYTAYNHLTEWRYTVGQDGSLTARRKE